LTADQFHFAEHIVRTGQLLSWHPSIARSILVFSGVGILAALDCQATYLVAMVEPDRIVIAADSRWTIGNRSEVVCKIHAPRAGCAFSIAGLFHQPETGFDSIALANRTCETPTPPATTPTSRAYMFGQIALPELKRAIDYSRREHPLIYNREFAGKKLLSGIFAGVENNEMVIVVESIVLNRDGNLHQETTRISRSTGNEIFMTGISADAAVRLLNKHPNWPRADLVFHMVEAEIDENPGLLGPPIAVLEVTRLGYTWIRPGVCAPPSLGSIQLSKE